MCPYYYYLYYGQYRCTISSQCPQNYNLLIKEKEMCINNCFMDDTFKYQYNGECLKECPINTNDDNNNYICEDNNKDICTLTQRDINILQDNITNEDIQILAETFSKEFNYTDNHISLFIDNNNYSIIFYKNEKCISELSLEISQIYFYLF